MVGATRHVIMFWGQRGGCDISAGRLGERVPSVVASAQIGRVGVGAVGRGDSGVILLVLQPSFIDTEPIPRRVAADRSAALRAQVRAPYRDPALFVTHEDGTVSRPRVSVGDQGARAAGSACRGPRGAPQRERTAGHSNGPAGPWHGRHRSGSLPPWAARISFSPTS